MADALATTVTLNLLTRVRVLVKNQLQKLEPLLGDGGNLEQLMPGKMLRTRLVARLADADPSRVPLATLERACAATEIVHTASLCHDDVIDNGLVRRAKTTLWCATTPSAAVLVGDALLCDALLLLQGAEGGRYVGPFLAKVREVCTAEADQELKFRGKELDEATCLRLARSKTGPLFAFAASVCGGDDADLSASLEEAGYRIGTAYQIADDVLDVAGCEEAAGKTLRTDVLRRKFTLPQAPQTGPDIAREHIRGLCNSAIDCLADQPALRKGLERFFSQDLQPIFDRCDLQPGL